MLASEATAKRFWELRPTSNVDGKIVMFNTISQQHSVE
jgi:hypothetical protein